MRFREMKQLNNYIQWEAASDRKEKRHMGEKVKIQQMQQKTQKERGGEKVW